MSPWCGRSSGKETHLFVALLAHQHRGRKDAPRVQQPAYEHAAVEDAVAIAVVTGLQQGGLPLIFESDSGAKGVSDPGMSFHHAQITLQRVIAAQSVIGRDQPHIPASGETDALVVVPQVAQVGFVADVVHARVLEGARHLGGIVRGAIVHDEDFEVAAGLRQDGGNTVGQPMGELVAGDDEADHGIGCAHGRNFRSLTSDNGSLFSGGILREIV